MIITYKSKHSEDIIYDVFISKNDNFTNSRREYLRTGICALIEPGYIQYWVDLDKYIPDDDYISDSYLQRALVISRENRINCILC